MIYVVPYFFMLFSGFSICYGGLSLRLSKSVFLLALMPAFLVVIFRGNIGVDTAAYESIIDNSYAGTCAVEPIFCWITNSMYSVVERADITLRFITFVFCALFFLAFCKHKADMVVASFFVFPLFFYDMSANGIRYGLAFVVFKLIHDAIGNKAIIAMPLYAGIQSSSVVLLMLSLADEIGAKLSWFVGVFIIAVLFLSGVYELVFFEYFYKKLNAYLVISSPSWYSGVFYVMVGSILLLVLGGKRVFSKKTVVLCFLFLFLFLFVSFFSYAGLRLMQLIIFFIAIKSSSLLRFYHLRSRSFFAFVVVFFVLGFLGFVNIIRAMIVSGYYFPYETIL